MDKLRLQGLTLFPQLGVTEWEKAGVNKVFVDVDLFLDLSVAAREDRDSATVVYSEAYQVLTDVSKSRKIWSTRCSRSIRRWRGCACACASGACRSTPISSMSR